MPVTQFVGVVLAPQRVGLYLRYARDPLAGFSDCFTQIGIPGGSRAGRRSGDRRRAHEITACKLLGHADHFFDVELRYGPDLSLKAWTLKL